MDVFAEFAVNDLKGPAMPFRMSRTLRFWVEVECEQQEINPADDQASGENLAGVRTVRRSDAVIKWARPGHLEGEPTNVGAVGRGRS